MKHVLLVAALTALAFALPLDAQATCDANDEYTTAGLLYIDDHLTNPSDHPTATPLPVPYVYLETNGQAGLQREVPDDDGFSMDASGHCGSNNPDQWLF
ncbi:MAG: hypothetical protein ACPGQL_03190 [Thermoplasmatota archaeon]